MKKRPKKNFKVSAESLHLNLCNWQEHNQINKPINQNKDSSFNRLRGPRIEPWGSSSPNQADKKCNLNNRRLLYLLHTSFTAAERLTNKCLPTWKCLVRVKFVLLLPGIIQSDWSLKCDYLHPFFLLFHKFLAVMFRY